STNIESNILEKRYFVKLVDRTIGTDANPIEYARQKGFQFGARDQISQSACGFATDGSISWNAYQDVSCKFSLFSGRKLKYPWKVKEIKIIRQTAALGREDVTNDYEFIRNPSGDNLYFTFLFEEEKLEDSPTEEFWEGARKVLLDPFKTPTQNPTVYGLKIYKFEYILQGPTGISWTDAFD
ncbi:MAG: hypothetical protein GWN56_01990, partial [Nitrosopumilaceae archaeon]|nr:hypothetical protein [Nitrosopumilaceae archaeon]NIV64914.1 hypothetical protein [Nitrosopumilaceae archaeon]